MENYRFGLSEFDVEVAIFTGVSGKDEWQALTGAIGVINSRRWPSHLLVGCVHGGWVTRFQITNGLGRWISGARVRITYLLIAFDVPTIAPGIP